MDLAFDKKEKVIRFRIVPQDYLSNFVIFSKYSKKEMTSVPEEAQLCTSAHCSLICSRSGVNFLRVIHPLPVKVNVLVRDSSPKSFNMEICQFS